MSGWYAGATVDTKPFPPAVIREDMGSVGRSIQPDAVTPLDQPLVDASSAGVSARVFDSAASSVSRTSRSLLHLQRLHGNRYLQRVLALVRQTGGEAEVAPEVESAIQRARGGGQCLDTGVGLQMESAFGTDVSGVRVHTDSEGRSLNEAVSAIVFTTGQDILFRQCTLSPGGTITHIGEPAEARLETKLQVGPPDGRYKNQADCGPGVVTVGESASPFERRNSSGDQTIGRQETSNPKDVTDQLPGPTQAKRSSLRFSRFPGALSQVIFRSDSVHPEEQHCQDVSEDSTASCAAIIHCIEELIEQLAGRFADIQNQGGDEGHIERIKIVQNILKTLMTMAQSTCEQGEYDDELAEEAEKWANKPAQTEVTDQDSQGTSSWDTVLKVVIALGLSVALVATIVAALADPEPATKLALAGLTFEEIEALGTALGFATAAAQ
jgi:hypothetical protein